MPRNVLRHFARRPAGHVVDTIIALTRYGLTEAELLRPCIRNADIAYLVPQIMAAQDDHAALFDKPSLGANRFVAQEAFVVVAMAVIGRLMRDEQVATKVVRASQRPGVTHPADGDARQQSIWIAGFECIHRSFPVDPTTIQRLQVVLDIPRFHHASAASNASCAR